jgi:hypothetical protein
MKKCSLIFAAILALTGCAKEKKEYEIRAELAAYSRPENATDRIEGQKFPYCLWYDPAKWMIWDTPFDTGKEVAEWNLILLDPMQRRSLGKHTVINAGASTYVFPEKNLARQDFKSLIQERMIGKGGLDAFADYSSDERIVNNIKLFSWNFTFTPANSEPITAYLYFYSDNEGSVSIITYTLSEKWEENKEDMLGLLNGFCLLRS